MSTEPQGTLVSLTWPESRTELFTAVKWSGKLQWELRRLACVLPQGGETWAEIHGYGVCTWDIVNTIEL
jgi:hypothetical protein